MTDVTPMTDVTFRDALDRMNVTQGQIADAWGYTRQQVSRWANGHTPIPLWVPYALGMATLGTGTPQKPAFDQQQAIAIAMPTMKPSKRQSPLDKLPEFVKPKPADDGRPFRYMGGRKVYL